MEPKISVILCDEVRVEDSGKLFVIGAYTDGLRSQDFPVREQLCALFTINGLPEGEIVLRLQVRTYSQNKSIEGNIVEHMIEGNAMGFTSNIFLRGVPVEIDEPGIFEMQGSIGDAPLDALTRLPIIVLE